MKSLLLFCTFLFLSAALGWAEEYDLGKVSSLSLEDAKSARAKIEPELQKGYAKVANAPAVSQAAIASVSAFQKHEQSVLQHPALKEQKKAVDAAMQAMIEKMKEKGIKDEQALARLREKYSAAREALFDASSEIQELVQLKKGSVMVRQIFEQTRDEELIKIDPGVKALIEYRKALDKRITELETDS